MTNRFSPDAYGALMTREQVAEALRISTARVRQIEFAALAKLRRLLMQRNMQLDDLIPDTTPDIHPLATHRQ